jgi:putative SOS response-associated peptidase YedK
MCGRFSLTAAEKEFFFKRFGISNVSFELKPRYNIAPSQMVAVIRNDIPEALSEAKWGFIPHWAKDDSSAYKMINARAETIANKPAYKDSFLHKRCLIPADSYYEWDHKGLTKRPYRILLKSEEVFGFAGIWDRWRDVISCSIVTTEPNALVDKLHDRMPVILPQEKEKLWLNGTPSEAHSLLKPADATDLKIYEIGSAINTAKNDSPDMIKPAVRNGLGRFF